MMFFRWIIVAMLVLSASLLAPTSHAAYRDTIVADTPLFYWPMDEATGSASLAATVGGIEINLTGATASTSGQVDGTAVSFNGTSDFGVTSASLDLTAYSKVFVEALVNYTDTGTNASQIAWEFSSSSTGVTTGFFYDFIQDAGPNQNILLKGDLGYTYAFYPQSSESTWHHVVAVYDKGAATNEVDLYIDGSLQTPGSRPANTNNGNNFGNHPLYLMSRGGTAFRAQGKMQHLAIYSDLSAATIASHSQLAFASDTITPGVLSEVSHAVTSASLAWTNTTGGTPPVAAQLQRSPHGAGTWSDVSGATSSPAVDTGLSASTSYDYRVEFTDGVSPTAYSNTVNVITDYPSITYTVQQADLWDNGYDNVAAPRQSPFSRFVFTTNAAIVTITGTTTIYANFPSYAQLGVVVDGVALTPLAFSANGTEPFVVTLGSEGVSKTVEIITGTQSRPNPSVIGTFIDSVRYPDTASFAVSPPTIGDRVVVYGDSISAGANSTNPMYQGYVPLLRTIYGYRVLLEGWGYRSLHEDANTSILREALVDRIAGYTPGTIWLAIGTNDYGLNKWSHTDFGTAYAALLDDLHTALPDAVIVCQTPLLRTTETANAHGSTLGDYRTQITAVCGARSWATLIDGYAFLTASDLAEGLHPTIAGHAKYARRISPVLVHPAYTVAGPVSGALNQASSVFTVTRSDTATFMGDQTVSITATNGTVSATAVGGAIDNNGTSSITVTPADTTTGFTFSYTPTVSGARTLLFSNAQGWSDPSGAPYTARSGRNRQNESEPVVLTTTPIPLPAAVTPTPSPSLPPPTDVSGRALADGDTFSAMSQSGDNDIFIIKPLVHGQSYGYKRLFLNPIIFSFYGHLGGFSGVRQVAAELRNAYETSALFRNCETDDARIWAIEVTGEDQATLHHVQMTGEEAVNADPNFFEKVFCINTNEYQWYPKSSIPYTDIAQIPVYQ